VDESIWIEKLIEHLRKKRGERRPDPREEWRPSPIRPERPTIRPYERGDEQWRPRPIRPERPIRPREEIEIEGIETLRGPR